jgi:SanA protein
MILFFKRLFTSAKGIVFLFVFLPLFILVWSNFSVYYESKKYISSDVNSLPKMKVGLMLGTSRFLGNDTPNAYFFNRIEAAVKLYNSGKIEYVLVSGDNGTEFYNEPEDMRNELILRGIPSNKIVLDFAGFDTYDSMIRAQKVFGQNEFIVISQHFHNQRAVYISRRFGIDAYAYDAADVKTYGGLRTKSREWFACVKAYFEVKLSVDPKFLGEKIVIQ